MELAIADRVLASALAELDVPAERVELGVFLATLPSSARADTLVWLVAGDHGVLVESLFVRAPARAASSVYAALLARNARTRAVCFALDRIGDVFLVGTLPYSALSTDEVDAALGQVLAHVDEAWAAVVEIGFGAGEDAAKWAASGAGRRLNGTAVATPDPDPRR